MKIYYGNHYNMKCMVMEKDKLILKVIPELGFKIASLVYGQKEFLFQSSDRSYV